MLQFLPAMGALCIVLGASCAGHAPPKAQRALTSDRQQFPECTCKVELPPWLSRDQTGTRVKKALDAIEKAGAAADQLALNVDGQSIVAVPSGEYISCDRDFKVINNGSTGVWLQRNGFLSDELVTDATLGKVMDGNFNYRVVTRDGKPALLLPFVVDEGGNRTDYGARFWVRKGPG